MLPPGLHNQKKNEAGSDGGSEFWTTPTMTVPQRPNIVFILADDLGKTSGQRFFVCVAIAYDRADSDKKGIMLAD